MHGGITEAKHWLAGYEKESIEGTGFKIFRV